MDKTIHYYRLPLSCTKELISYVITENYLHHGVKKEAAELESESAVLCAEEAQYTDSYIFAAMAGNRLCGSIRICKKLPGQVLPLEKMYGLDISALVPGGASVYHIGRFAVSKGADGSGIRVFKTLMALALHVADKDPAGTVFAECDRKLLRTVRHLGIEAEPIGKPVFYLGSETVPVQMPRGSYQKFLEANTALLHEEVLRRCVLPESPVPR